MSEKAVKNQKARFKPNVIDFLIVVVILGAIVGIALRAGVVDKVTQGSRMESAQVSFLILDINEQSGNYFKVGDTFTSPSLDCEVGVLDSVQFMPAEAFITTPDGHLIKTYSDNHRIDVRGTMTCEGIFSDVGFLLGGNQYIAPGSTVNIQSRTIDVFMMVTDIVKSEE
ncbi:MAG: DUF4330 family protein [Ruminococcaceae bacterium]|nr:DUF4330 family protein [Oscillospiraceae bacterium]